MKTTFDQDTILYQRLKTAPLKNAITGGIYLWNRPDGSLLEDVVINALPMTGESVQRCTANVNIYAANLSVKVGGKMQDVADITRLQTLAGIALQTLWEGYGPDYNYWVSNQGVLAEDDIHQHYLNLRIEFKFHNQN